MNVRKTISILLISALLFCPVCNACSEAAEPDYYHIGLEVTALMGEMVDSEAYLSLLSQPETFSEILERVNTHDYDRPAAVYSVSLSDPRSYLEELLDDDPDSRETWDSLSPALQDQFLARMSLPALLARSNVRAGAVYMALFSAANAVIRNETLTGEAPCYYLYFFQKGAPILVSFGYHTASGQFLSIPGEYWNSPVDTCTYLGLPGLVLVPVKTAESASASAVHLTDFGVDPAKALRKMDQLIGENIPPSGRFAPDRYEMFDLTGDGCPELFTCVTWGSGMVRTDLIVYDPVNEELYVLDGYNYDYLIDRVGEDRIVIIEEGPHGYGDPVRKTYGTVKLERRKLVFIPDAEEP